MSGFANALKKRAAQTGRVVVQGTEKETEVVKTETKAAFASVLKAKKQSAAEVADPTKIKTGFEKGLIKTWSFSGMSNYEKCGHLMRLAKVDKIPQKDSPAAARGNMIHDMLESYVRGDIDELIGDRKTRLDHFKADLNNLRVLFEEGKVDMEEEWGFRDDWSPCEYHADDVWGRAKLDVFHRESETSCRIIDYKTGRKFGNEVKHSDQGLSYALNVFHRYPEIDNFTIEFWYMDQAEKMIRRFTRRQLALLLGRYHQRAVRMTTDTQLKPRPNVDSCRFCPYGSNTNRDGVPYGNGACPHDHYGEVL